MRKAGSVVGTQMDRLTSGAQQRTMDRRLSIVDNLNHPLYSAAPVTVVTVLLHGHTEEIVPPLRHSALQHLTRSAINTVELGTYTRHHTKIHPPVGLWCVPVAVHYTVSFHYRTAISQELQDDYRSYFLRIVLQTVTVFFLSMRLSF